MTKNQKKTRVTRAKKGTQEFFTPEYIIDIMLDNVPDSFFKNKEVFHESCCGNGNILVKVYNKYRQFHDHETAISCIHAFDYMPDNVVETIKRLYGPGDVAKLDTIPEDMQHPGIISVFTHNGNVIKNIFCADALKLLENKEVEPVTNLDIFNNIFEYI